MFRDSGRKMFWYKNNSSVHYFYNLEYDYGIVDQYLKYQRINEMHFKNLLWINWLDIRTYVIIDKTALIYKSKKYYIFCLFSY